MTQDHDCIGALGTILSIWAHPDDETYLAGGLMATATGRGQRVVSVSASAGERGTDDPERWPPQRLGALRRTELAAALDVLGVTEHHVLGLPDGELHQRDQEGRALVAALVEEVRPDTVVTFGPDGATFHPDHIAVHRWVTDVWQARRQPFRLLYAALEAEYLDRFADLFEEWGVYMTAERPGAHRREDLALHLRLDGAQVARKQDALRAMPSQTAAVLATVDQDRFVAHLAEEAFVDATMLATWVAG